MVRFSGASRQGAVVAAVLVCVVILSSATPADATPYCPAGASDSCAGRVVGRSVAAPGLGARGAGIRPGTAWNRGGPVNRVGRR